MRLGLIGLVHTVRSTTVDPGSPPDACSATSGGIFRDCNVHDLDAVRFASGREVVEAHQHRPIRLDVIRTRVAARSVQSLAR